MGRMSNQSFGPEGVTTIYETEDPEFYFSATLRIAGEIESLDEITSRLSLRPTHSHRRGDRRGLRSPPYKDDLWSYSPPVDEHEPLERHISALWDAIRPNATYLKELKRTLKVDVFCGFRTNCRIAGFEVEHQHLRMFAELEIPFAVSIITLD